MIQVLIAEDEPPTLRRISAMVEQLDPAFCVIATALNGREALRKLTEVHVDVVLTDIRMPVMDGMQLMDQIRERFPDCMIVVLSGHQEFEYMAHAIRANSLDYLLKPVSTDAMQELLRRIKTQYLRASRERITRNLSAHLSKAAGDGTRARASEVKLGLCLFCAGGMPLGEDAEMYPGAEVWSSRSLEAFALKVVPNFTNFTWEFMGSTLVERILIYQAEEGQFESWVKCLHEMLIDEEELPISCVCLSTGIPLGEINAALKWMRGVLRSRIRIGRSVFVCLNPSEDQLGDACETSDDTELSIKLAALLSTGRIGLMTPFRRELFQRMEREGWTQQRTASLFMEAIHVMERDASEAIRSMAHQYCGVLREATSMALSFKALEDEVSSLPALTDVGASGSPIKQAEIVDGIEQYLRSNYADHVTNQTLATVFGYVPSYISFLFRQKYQLSPSEYLTQVRIGEAKKLMQVHPEMLIRDVADRVGFKNQHHFSRIFKKNEGMWPSSYQS